MDVVGTQKTFSRIFQKKEMKKENKLKKISSDINTYKELNDLTGDLKKEIFINYQEQNKIFASGFVRYRIKLAKSLKELDRWDTSNLKSFDAYFPMTWCFGTYLTCQFSELDDYLNTQSNKTDNDLSFLDDFYKSTDPKDFEYMLKNTELRKKEKEEKSKSKKKETNNASL